MSRKPDPIDDYLAALPADRREALSAVRRVILENLDSDYEEGIQYGMIGYYVPHRVYANGYHCDPRQPLPFASLASQKNHMALYLMGVYGSPEQERWLRDAWTKAGKKLDMGKACIRFKKLEDVPLDVVGAIVKRIPAKAYIAGYEAQLAASGRGPAKKAGAKKVAKKAATKKTAKKAAKAAPAKKAAKKVTKTRRA